jgi:nucleoside 2-deoxyribosyltransferase
MSQVFNVEWVASQFFLDDINKIIVHENKAYGKFAVTKSSLIIEDDETKYYKYLSIIYECTINNRPLIICADEETDIAKKWNEGRNTISNFENIEKMFPTDLLEKQMRILSNIYTKYPLYGQNIDEIETYECFARDNNELIFMLNTLMRKEFIELTFETTSGGSIFWGNPGVILEKGWIEIEQNIKKQHSKNVFIAMWFDSRMEKAFQEIKRALNDLGLNAIRIDKVQHNNEISGEILKKIKDCKFLIADVTNQRNGVYFEAGFALGLQKKIIWSCKKDDLTNIHFDTRQYNHIIWESENDIYEKFKDRIAATVLFD